MEQSKAVRRARAATGAWPRQRRFRRGRGGPACRRTQDLQAYDRRKAGGVSEETSPTIAIRIEIDDPALADRLASLLGGIAGLRLAAPGEAADVAIVSRDTNSSTLDLLRASSTCSR